MKLACRFPLHCLESTTLTFMVQSTANSVLLSKGNVIVVPWVSRVYRICTLSVLLWGWSTLFYVFPIICIRKGKVPWVYNYTQGTNPIHLRNPWYRWLVPCFPDIWELLATAEALVVLAAILPRVYEKMKGCARVYDEWDTGILGYWRTRINTITLTLNFADTAHAIGIQWGSFATVMELYEHWADSQQLLYSQN